MHHFVSDLVSPEVAARVGRVWGYGSGVPLPPATPHMGLGRGAWGGEGGEGAGRGAPLTCVGPYPPGTHLDPAPWEGELRNMWRPTAQRGLWFSGGNLAQARTPCIPLCLPASVVHLPAASAVP